MSVFSPSLCETRQRKTIPAAVNQRAFDAAVVLQSFNTWAFKRQQPTEPELLQKTVTESVAKLQPIEFVLYWGKGPRTSISSHELSCLNFLHQIVSRIRYVYPVGAKITLVLTDTHAEHNGHSAANIESYFADVTKAAAHHGFACRSLKSIVISAEDSNVAHTEMPSDAILEKLTPSAKKWYRGAGTIKEAAIQYYRLNMVEKRAVGHHFPGFIFITFNGSEFRELFPESLPAFYTYSTRKGQSVKPWFMDEVELDRAY